MDIAPYIKDLLNEQGQVCVPGLGLFIRRRIQGFYDAAAGVLRPPSLKLELIEPSQVTEELTNFISQKKHISTASAGYFIRQFVDQLHLRLKNGEVALEGLGIISVDNGQITFRNTSASAGKFFGLGPFDLVTLSLPENEPQKEQPVIIETSQTEEPLPQPEKHSSPSYVYWLLTVLIALLVGGIAYHMHPEWFPFHQPEKQEQNQHIPPAEQATATPPADTVQIEPDTAGQTGLAETVATDTPATAAQGTENPAQASDEKTITKSALVDTAQYEPQAYEIIGASFKTLSSARSELERFGWKGVKAKILKNTRGKRIKISLGSFKEPTSAQMELKRLRAELKNNELFIEPYKQQ